MVIGEDKSPMKLLFCTIMFLYATASNGQTTSEPIDTNADGEAIIFGPHGEISGTDKYKIEIAKPAFDNKSEIAEPSWIPRPMLFFGGFSGGGYEFAAPIYGAGFLVNSSKLVSDFEASYGASRKNDDGTVNNRKGHERYLNGRVFYRRGKLYFGGGAQWSETSTTNYTKKSWRPTFGVGRDQLWSDFKWRWQIVYILPGDDYYNGLQGPQFEGWFPSPATNHHYFLRYTVGTYEFHSSVTDRSNVALTNLERSHRDFSPFADIVFGWRF